MSYFLVTNDPNTKLTRGTCAGAAGPPWLLNGESRKAVAMPGEGDHWLPTEPKSLVTEPGAFDKHHHWLC